MKRLAVLLACVATLVCAPGTPAVASSSAALAWTTSSGVDPLRGGTRAISCPTSTFCGIVDTTGRFVVLSHGSRRSAVSVSGSLISVACRSTAFCVVGGSSGYLHLMHSGRWARAVPVGSGNVFVSCSSTSSCLAVSARSVSVYAGGVWSAPRQVAGAREQFTAVSCATASFCVALALRSDSGRPVSIAYRWRGGTTWTRYGDLYPYANHAISSISCVSTSLCRATGTAPEVLRYNGRHWAFDGNLDGGDFHSISCVGTSFCMVASTGSAPGIRVSRLVRGQWTESTSLLNTGSRIGVSVSCSSTTACAVVDWAGDGRRWNGKSWASPGEFDHGQGNDGQGSGPWVSCGAPTLCVAIDSFGNYLTYRGASWSAPQRIAPTAQGMSEISCVGTHFCLTVSGAARAWVFNGTTWRGSAVAALPHGVGVTPLVSCASATYCLAASGSGLASVFNGKTWAKPVRFDPQKGQTSSISCTASRFCAIVDSEFPDEKLFTFDGHTWRKPQVIPAAPNSALSIGCAGTGFCLITSYDSHVLTYAGATFGHVEAASSSLLGSSCVSSQYCVIDEYGSYQVWNGTSLEAPLPLTADILADDSDISCVAPRTCAAAGLSGAAVGR